MKKVRGDSILGTLPRERQEAVAEYAQGHTLADTRDWLAADGLKVSAGAISTWLSDWAWQAKFRLVEQDTLRFMELAKRQRPDLREDELEKFGNDFFQLQAVRLADPKMFLRFRSARTKARIEQLKLEQGDRALRQREDALKLEREKFERLVCERALTSAVQAIAAEIAGRNVSHEEKISAMRQALFADVSALQESGGLTLPS